MTRLFYIWAFGHLHYFDAYAWHLYISSYITLMFISDHFNFSNSSFALETIYSIFFLKDDIEYSRLWCNVLKRKKSVALLKIEVLHVALFWPLLVQLWLLLICQGYQNSSHHFNSLCCLIIDERLNTCLCFGPLTYFWILFWSHNYKVFQFGPINLMSFTILVLSVRFFTKSVNSFHVSFKIGDQQLDLKIRCIPSTNNIW